MCTLLLHCPLFLDSFDLSKKIGLLIWLFWICLFIDLGYLSLNKLSAGLALDFLKRVTNGSKVNPSHVKYLVS